MDARAGSVLDGRYALREVIGDGATATVWRATDRRLDRDVAVKIVRPGALDATGRQRARAESRALARFTHPHLVGVYDAQIADEPDALTYVVLELVEGPSLRDTLAEGPIAPREAAPIGAAVASALVHLHDHGVVHRDVKPANVLLGPDGEVKLTDLGIARFADATRLTGTGLLIGTPAYLAPEQVEGGPVTGAADVYALGLTMLESITGERAYDGSGVEGAVARLHRDPEIPADVSPPWRNALSGMLQREPTARTSAAVLPLLFADLATDHASATTALLAAPLPEEAGDGPTGRRGFVILGAVAAAVVLVLALATTGGGADHPTAPGPSPTPTPTLTSPTPPSVLPAAVTVSPPGPKPPKPGPGHHGKGPGHGDGKDQGG